jgi:hypothetical protein
MSCCRDDDPRSNAIHELEAAAMLVAASPPDDPEALAADDAALKGAREAGFTPEEITTIANESVEILGDLIVTLTQVGSIHVEGIGTLVPTEKARKATAPERDRVHAKYAPNTEIEA